MRVTALDPQAAAVLARLAANGGRPLHEQTPAEARLGASGFLELFGPGEQVASVEHRFIPGPTADLPVRIYTPLTGCAPFPALVSFHGSGFVISNIGVFDAPNRALANRTGCIVVAVNYQKAPEHRFPVPFDDAYAATQWVFDHAAELGVDAGRIGVIGDRPALVRPAIPAHRGQRWRSVRAPLRAPSLAGLPPVMEVTAEYDPLRDEGEQYAERLRAAGVRVVAKRFDGMIHGFYGMSAVLDAANELFDDIAAFVRTLD